MVQLSVSLFGKLCVGTEPQTAIPFDSHKAQELLVYLLLRRERAHTREALATLLWPDAALEKSKGYLRKTLWKLQSTIDNPQRPSPTPLLAIDPDWIQVNPTAVYWLDVAEFEQAHSQVQGQPGSEMDAALAKCVAHAVALYRGDLLDGWYQEWCLFERERLRRMHLIMLDKLMTFCEAHRCYEDGLAYGMRILKEDIARERTHRRLMRLHYLTGNRSEALHQFERCAAILHQELGVEPSRRTVALHEQIRADQLMMPDGRTTAVAPTSQPLQQALIHLQTLQSYLLETQKKVQHDIEVIETTLNRIEQSHPPHHAP